LRRTTFRLGVTIAALAVGVTIIVFHYAPATDPPPRYVPAQKPRGIVLHQNARAIETGVLTWLGPKSRILSVRVIARRADLARALPEYGGSGPSLEHGGPAWIVRAHGLFEPLTLPLGGLPRTSPSTGFVIFDDATGRRLGYGFGRVS
jgi:hypothetical protein